MSAHRWVSQELGLIITTDGDDLVIEKEGRKYRAARRKATALPVELATTRYRHPTGFEIVMPPNWQVTHGALGLQLVPPDTAYTPHGPAEIYALATQPVPGIVSVEDPRILMLVDRQLRQLIPTIGAPSPSVASPPGVVLKWTGHNTLTNGEVLAIAYLRLVGSMLVGVVGLGERARIEARILILDQIFRSYTQGQGLRDPALVGTWHYWSYTGGQHASSEHRRVVQLAPDGRLVEQSLHEGSANLAGRDAYGNQAWNAGYASQNTSTRHGTWTAGESILYITWSDGQQAAWPYQVAGVPGQRKLLLASGTGGPPIEWLER